MVENCETFELGENLGNYLLFTYQTLFDLDRSTSLLYNFRRTRTYLQYLPSASARSSSNLLIFNSTLDFNNKVTHKMSAPYEPYSDESGNDSDDAPEEVTLSTAKKGLQQEKKKALEEQRRYVRMSYSI